MLPWAAIKILQMIKAWNTNISFVALAVAMLSLPKQCESNFNDKTKRHIPNQYVAITMTAIIIDTVHTESLQKYLGVQ